MPELLHPGVYVQEVSSGVHTIAGVATSTAAFIGVTDKGPLPGTLLPDGTPAQATLVNSFTEYQRTFGNYRQDSFLTYSAKSYFDNGGQSLYVVRVAPPGAAAATSSAVTSPPTSPPGSFPLAVSAVNQGLWGDNIWVAVDYSSSYPFDGSAPTTFKLVVMYAQTTDPTVAARNVVEVYDGVSPADPNPSVALPATYAGTTVNRRSEYIRITARLTAVPLAGAHAPVTPTPFVLRGGSDGTGAVNSIGAPSPDGNLAGTGLYALDKVTDVELIAIPGAGDAATINAGVDYCKISRNLQDCFFIADIGSLDTPSARQLGALPLISGSPATVAAAKAFATGGTLDKSAGDFGAMYFPWIWSADPIGIGRNPQILLPPSGFLAGIYARTDNSRGVFKAPAGTEAGLAGALGASVIVGDTDQDGLNPNSVNAVRTVPGSGLVVWGARTFGSDTEWLYVPVRRMAIFLRTSIYYGIQWAVFEPNDEPLWSSLRLNIRSFMLTQFRAGAFQGATPDDAFFVKCDASTTQQVDIDNGVVNILVGFAPLKPAEFVVLQLSQKLNPPTS